MENVGEAAFISGSGSMGYSYAAQRFKHVIYTRPRGLGISYMGITGFVRPTLK